MPEVRKATCDDFEDIYSLLLNFNNPLISKEDWKRLFILPWDTEENYRGYILVEKSKVVGFLGYIFSRRYIDGNVHKICNLTTWIVEEEYWGHSLELFYPVLDLKDYTITDFSPTEKVFKILHKRYKFKILETSLILTYPIPGISYLFSKGTCCIQFNDEIDHGKLDHENNRVFHDHRMLKCDHVLVESHKGTCYIVLKKQRFKKLYYMEVYYISDPNIFLENIDNIKIKICMEFKTIGLLIEERLLQKNKLRYSIEGKPYVRKLYKTESLDIHHITSLYTEKLLL